jgi:hypothetical protein
MGPEHAYLSPRYVGPVATLVCPSCSFLNSSTATYCVQCGRVLAQGRSYPSQAVPTFASRPLPERESLPFPQLIPLPPRKRDPILLRAVVIAMIFLVIVVILAAVFYFTPRPFIFSVPTGGCEGENVTLPLPRGASVGFNWSSSGGSAVLLSVHGPTGSSIYATNATGGSGRFHATRAGGYVFTASSCARGGVNVYGSFTIA